MEKVQQSCLQLFSFKQPGNTLVPKAGQKYILAIFSQFLIQNLELIWLVSTFSALQLNGYNLEGVGREEKGKK